jgi:hypothetical protein
MISRNLKLTLVAMIMFLTVSSCTDEPEALLTSTKTRAKVGDIVEFLIIEADNYSCLLWSIAQSSPRYEIIAGGTGEDVSLRVRFLEAGDATVSVNLKKCASNANLNASDCTCGGGQQRQINKNALVIIEP